MQTGDNRIPDRPGGVSFQKGIIITRLTSSECRLMVLNSTQEVQYGPDYTDVTDAFAAFALVGPQCLEALSKLSAVDLAGPGKTPPFAALAPLEEVTCLFVYLKGRGGIPGLIVSVARGYGQFLLDAFADAGKEWGMSPAGCQRFTAWLP
jgi:glycine cleavage system aminomethyltransferase T